MNILVIVAAILLVKSIENFGLGRRFKKQNGEMEV